MSTTEGAATSSRWPTGTEYAAAVQQPSTSFSDAELRGGVLTLTPLGIPASASGQNAIAFHMQAATRPVAVRCLLSANDDGRLRYRALERYVEANNIPSVVSATWFDDGVRVHDRWWPIVVMPWVEGDPLHLAIEDRLDDPARLVRVADRWLDLVETLQARRFAHGDYQHGNVLLTESDDFQLVDLDGIWVPDMGVGAPNEFGHPNYQHVNRSDTDWGPYVDTFSALVIAVSILALAHDADLIRFMTGENLLFAKPDFEDPDGSEIWGALARSTNDEVADLAGRLFAMASAGRPPSLSVREVLDASFDPHALLAVQPGEAASVPRATALAETGPEWWTEERPDALATPVQPGPPVGQQTSAPHSPGPRAPSSGGSPFAALATQPLLAGLLCGGLAGLLGSFVAGVLQGIVDDPATEAGLLVGLIAALLGALTHAFPALAAGRWLSASRHALIGGAVGITAGVVAVLVAEVMMRSTLGVDDTENAVLVAYVWALAAALVGLATGLLRSPRAAAYAFSGGALAGFVGGLIHGFTSATFEDRALRANGFDPAVLITATVVSALIGVLVSLAIRTARLGSLVVVGGPGVGTVVDFHGRNVSVGGFDFDTLVISGRNLPVGAVHLQIGPHGAEATSTTPVAVDGVPQPERFGVVSGQVLAIADVLVRVDIGSRSQLGGVR